MTDFAPITPPPLLVEQWLEQCLTSRELAAKAFQAGADMELDAWISAVLSHPGFEQPELFVELLRADRRPKPPSLKEQAYNALDTYIYGNPDPKDKERTYNTIRRALEKLND